MELVIRAHYFQKWLKLSYLFTLSIVFHYTPSYCQSAPSEIACIGFYNLENLFDTFRDTNILDEEFTPKGSKSWTLEKYNEKLNNLASVISDLGKNRTPNGAILLGVSEIENRGVLRDLLATKLLSKEGFQIIHYDSKDSRGIDVALLYKSNFFKVLESTHFPVLLTDSLNGSKYTRDVLLVKGVLGGEIVYVTVNHWPSRRGGTKATNSYRVQVADLNYHLFDSIRKIDSAPAFIIMGDLNDNPTNESIRKHLFSKNKPNQLTDSSLFNPFYEKFKNGEGSLAHNDSWSMFDQILISKKLVIPAPSQFQYFDNEIYHREFMIELQGHFKNYPKRSFNGDIWNNGFSDHFPVLIYLLKKK